VLPHRHGGAWPRHPRLCCWHQRKDVDGRPAPAMTIVQRRPRVVALIVQRVLRLLASISAPPIRIATSLAGGVYRAPLARLDRAPRPALPRRTQSSHSYNRRYRRRTPRPDLSSASRRRELPRDGCANSHETEGSAATGDGLLARHGGGVSMARKVPSGRKARPATASYCGM